MTDMDFLSKIARESMEHSSPESLKKYLKEHPKADPKNHSVSKGEPSDGTSGPPSGDPVKSVENLKNLSGPELKKGLGALRKELSSTLKGMRSKVKERSSGIAKNDKEASRLVSLLHSDLRKIKNLDSTLAGMGRKTPSPEELGVLAKSVRDALGDFDSTSKTLEKHKNSPTPKEEGKKKTPSKSKKENTSKAPKKEESAKSEKGNTLPKQGPSRYNSTQKKVEQFLSSPKLNDGLQLIGDVDSLRTELQNSAGMDPKELGLSKPDQDKLNDFLSSIVKLDKNLGVYSRMVGSGGLSDKEGDEILDGLKESMKSFSSWSKEYSELMSKIEKGKRSVKKAHLISSVRRAAVRFSESLD